MLLAVLGLYTCMWALLNYCNAISQSIVVYTGMEAQANPTVLAVSANWMNGSRRLAVTVIIASFITLLVALSHFFCQFCCSGPLPVGGIENSYSSVRVENEEVDVRARVKDTTHSSYRGRTDL